MANIRINALPNEAAPSVNDVVPIDNATTRKTTIKALVQVGRPAASQAEAEAGTDAEKAMTPLTTKQAIAAQGPSLFATKSQGDKADTAVQPSDLGSAAYASSSSFATASQGSKADSAVQTVNGKTGTSVTLTPGDVGAATAGQGALADSAMQPAVYAPNNPDQDAFDSANHAVFTTVQLASKPIPVTVSTLWSAGYSSAGDGGAARYSRVNVEPSHDLKFQSSDGAWWEIAERQIWAEMAGASVGAGDNATAIQKVLDYLESTGGGICLLGAGEYKIADTLILPSRVEIWGQGSGATSLYLADNSDCDLVKSKNYDTLVGSGTYLIADGNNYCFGLSRLRLVGNKDNQSSGDGVKFYGKRVKVYDLTIADVKGEGWHSESNYTLGPGTRNAEGLDMPEGVISGLFVWGCGGSGFVFRGQHDSRIDSLFVGSCGGWGARFETSSGDQYSGGCDVGFAHIYANDSGVYVGADVRFGSLISESNYKNGIEVTTYLCQADKITAYSNGRTTGAGYVNVLLNGAAYFCCPNLQVRTNAYDAGGVKIVGGLGHQIATTIYGSADGTNTRAGLEMTGGRTSKITASIIGFNGTGARGAYLNSSSTSSEMEFDLAIENCASAIHNGLNSARSSLRARVRRTSTQIGLESGSISSSKWDWAERIDTGGVITEVFSSNSVSSLGALDLNSTSEQVVSLAHNLIKAPLASMCKARFQPQASNTALAVQYFYVSAVSSTNVQVKFKLSTAAGSALLGDLFIDATL